MKALYTEITDIAPIAGADRIKLATIQGYTVIVSAEAKPGLRGLFIQEGSQLSEAFALEHGLLAEHPETGEKLGGYLRSNRKVSTLTLRGAKSYGVFCPMTLEGLNVGDEIDTLPGSKDPFVCRYETTAQRKAKQANAQPLAREAKVLQFPEHYDTAQLARNAAGLIHADKIVITEKLHGTSGRTGFADVVIQYGRFKRWASRRFEFVRRWWPLTKREVVTGSRRQNFAHRTSGDEYRNVVHAALAPLIRDGEIWYYEIVGFTTSGASIMPKHGKNQWSYGCKPDGAGLGEQYRVYVYRINANGQELGYDQIANRVREAHREDASSFHVDTLAAIEWLAPVPKLAELDASTIGPFTPAGLIELASQFENGKSTLDRSHIREGVCLRGESLHGDAVTNAQKRKSHAFLTGENLLADDDTMVDPEDVA